MSGLKAIRRRITSVKNTKQITRAMKLVSAAKLRKAQDAALNGRSFADQLKLSLETIQRELPPDFTHPLLDTSRPVRRRRVIVMAGERGLCGAYNTNVIKLVQAHEGEALGTARVEIVPVGKQAANACKRFGWATTSFEPTFGEDASQWPVQAIAASLLADYVKGEFDELVIYYTQFVSAMTLLATRMVVLPFQAQTPTPNEAAKAQEGQIQVTRFEPRPDLILEKLLPLLLGTQLRQAGLEAKASEHSARMTAMDSATRNADDLIGKLRLFYNRARQSAITRELIDIVGGAEAIS